jgi:26S proteasome regulatory subunit T5
MQGVNKDSYLILEKLPTEYDSRVKAMELDERPTEQYSDIGGLDTQIQEVLPNPFILSSTKHACFNFDLQ